MLQTWQLGFAKGPSIANGRRVPASLPPGADLSSHTWPSCWILLTPCLFAPYTKVACMRKITLSEGWGRDILCLSQNAWGLLLLVFLLQVLGLQRSHILGERRARAPLPAHPCSWPVRVLPAMLGQRALCVICEGLSAPFIRLVFEEFLPLNGG